MKAFEISEDNLEEFEDLLGEDMIEDMDRMFYRGYGTRDADGNINGAMIYEVKGLDDDDKDTSSQILFIKAEDEEAYAGLHEIYKEDGVKEDEITDTFYEFEDEGMASSCEKEGFTKGSKESDIVRITLSDASKFDFINKFKKIPDYIVSLSELSVSQFRAAIKNCEFNGQHGILEDLSYLPMGWFDGDLSSCTITDGEVNGVFLIRRTPSGVIIPVLLFATGTDSVKNLALMIAHSVKEAEELFDPDITIEIHRTRKASAALIKKLIPDIKGEVAFFGERIEK
jgi:hypothetical protein